MPDFTYQTNLYSTLHNLIFKLEQWQVEVESTWRKVKRLKSEDIFWSFWIYKEKMINERKKMCVEMK